MNSIKTVLLALFILIGLQKNLAQSADPLTYIPKQAQNVYVFNMPSIISKMDVNALKNLDFVKEIMDKANNPKIQSYLHNPAESGINILKPITFVISDIDTTDYQSLAVILSLSNSAKLNTVLTSSGLTITQKNGLSQVASDTTLLVWNEQMFVVMSLKKKKDGMSALMALKDSTAEMPKPPVLDPSVYFQNSEVNARAEALRGLMRTPHDIYIYQTTDGTGKSMRGMMASMMFGLQPTDLDGNVTTGWADFENGRIYGESAQKMNEAMSKKFSSIGRAKPSVNWNEYINTNGNKNPAFMMSFSLNPLGLKDMLSENEMLKQGVNQATAKSNKKFSMDKILTTFGGDVFATMSVSDKDMDYLVGLSLADKKGAEKMLKEELKLKKVSKNLYAFEPKKTEPTEGGMTAVPKIKSKMLVLIKDNVALIGKESQIMALKTAPKLSGLTTETTDWQKSLKNKPMNMFFDFKTLTSSFPAAQDKLGEIPFESISMSMFNRITSFEIKMLDKDKNALTTFFTFMDKIIKDKKEKANQPKTLPRPTEKEDDGN